MDHDSFTRLSAATRSLAGAQPKQAKKYVTHVCCSWTCKFRYSIQGETLNMIYMTVYNCQELRRMKFFSDNKFKLDQSCRVVLKCCQWCSTVAAQFWLRKYVVTESRSDNRNVHEFQLQVATLIMGCRRPAKKSWQTDAVATGPVRDAC